MKKACPKKTRKSTSAGFAAPRAALLSGAPKPASVSPSSITGTGTHFFPVAVSVQQGPHFTILSSHSQAKQILHTRTLLKYPAGFSNMSRAPHTSQKNLDITKISNAPLATMEALIMMLVMRVFLSLCLLSFKVTPAVPCSTNLVCVM